MKTGSSVVEFELLTTKFCRLEAVTNECIVKSQRKESLISFFGEQGKVPRQVSRSSRWGCSRPEKGGAPRQRGWRGKAEV